uniref:Reverse transcriptase zinc-binding domain-containing protein n=1 Tax=Lactuca sativa TaxID=4236 RepID=A0A9R1XWI2_LACSA|nr:hypothetical protein LSAT_V11C100034420 [Lactuca sativa]
MESIRSNQRIKVIDGCVICRVMGYSTLMLLEHSSTGESLKWTHEVPWKVNYFIWRAKLYRLPTARALTRRGIQIMSVLCPYCELEEEDTAHVLFRCPMASKVWEYVCHWCNIPYLQFQNAEEMVKYVAQWGTCSKKR